jgi:hypothetical protein
VTPARYRKKPVVIEAVQWDGTAVGATLIIDWVLANDGTASFVDYDGPEPYLRVRTVEGDMAAGPHWWIIRGVEGEFYPCKPTVFATTYELA